MIPRNPGTVHERQRSAAYTPVWTSSGTAPAIGNGSITGRYSVTNNEVHVVINVVFGSTSTYGTGFWSFSLPFTAHASFVQMLPGHIVDSSAGPLFGPVVWAVAAGAGAAGGGIPTYQTPAGLVGTAQPFSWATGDAVYIAGTYFASST